MPAHLYLSAALEGVAVPRRRAGAPSDTDSRREAHLVRLARLAEAGDLDFVTLDDRGRAGPSRGPAAGRSADAPRQDALAVPARVAAATTRIGLVPAVGALPSPTLFPPTSTVGRFAAGGRAGWLLTEPGCPEAERAGHRPPLAVVLDGHGPDVWWRFAARHADVVLLDAEHPAAARACRRVLGERVAEAGRPWDALRVLLRIGVELTHGDRARRRTRAETVHFAGTPADLGRLLTRWHAAGVADGFHLLPVHAVTDLLAVVNGLVPRLQDAGVQGPGHRGTALRDRLGLAR